MQAAIRPAGISPESARTLGDRPPSWISTGPLASSMLVASRLPRWGSSRRFDRSPRTTWPARLRPLLPAAARSSSSRWWIAEAGSRVQPVVTRGVLVRVTSFTQQRRGASVVEHLMSLGHRERFAWRAQSGLRGGTWPVDDAYRARALVAVEALAGAESRRGMHR